MKAKVSVGTLVINHHKELREFTSHIQLKAWAEKHQLNTAVLFSQFKRRLFDIGIDYDKLKELVSSKLEAEISHELTLYCSANPTYDKFGITNHLGDVLWYGRFFDQDNSKSQADADLSAATKAIWLASKIKASNPLISKLRLNLFVDALWLTFQMHDKQKAYILSQLARKYNLVLKMDYVDKEKNLASRWSAEMGFKKWSDNVLLDLPEPVLQNVLV